MQLIGFCFLDVAYVKKYVR